MHLVVISGRSGSGKSTALHQLEDEGYYCIDNMPARLLPGLFDTDEGNTPLAAGIAVCIDSRNILKDLEQFPALLESLPPDVDTDVVFLDAEDAALLMRFSETRRRHPLSDDNTSLAEAIRQESALLEPLASRASLLIDTSQMTIYELRSAIRQRILGNRSGDMSVLFQSFGFKRGLPSESDLIYDLRMLPNPHWDAKLRKLNGRDSDVIAYLQQQPVVEEYYQDICRFLDRWLPEYQANNRSYMTIALGCTGGQHRSVYVTERLYERYRQSYSEVHIRHRELLHW
ncbi:RNase adapter RapZ [Halieaceae bacterium IMCC14734]|uniref:RNase adapter RapZ n=1 Tax=Candidatus Litorirhabdus singularis TaxID=2518993 RepID=A0ABT3TL20_9GAMM|nr:RNase adapter RapZ [Candidatus Litorirhabdus singularis]MCX2982460.1 RNase adapter RapZ [Candidatus Litorirhabdus singularis]